MERSMTMKLDNKYREIISIFATNPEASQEQIAKRLGISQPSVAMRIKNLKEMGALDKLVGLNPLKMGYYMAKVDVASNQPSKIVEQFKECPYLAHSFSVSGKHNLCLFFVGKNISNLESLVNHHIRTDDSVTDMEFNILINSAKPFIIPIIVPNDSMENPPCGKASTKCQECDEFTEGRCIGCPAFSDVEDALF